MQIVSRKDFLQMPAGTFFMLYSDGNVEPQLGIKVSDPGKYENDFDVYYFGQSDIAHQNPDDLSEKLIELARNGEPFKMDGYMVLRDGQFNNDATYYTFTFAEIAKLSMKLVDYARDQTVQVLGIMAEAVRVEDIQEMLRIKREQRVRADFQIPEVTKLLIAGHKQDN